MYQHPLTPGQLRDYRDALVQSHRMRLRVYVLDQDEASLGSLTAPASLVLGGSVTVDTTAAQSRSLSLDVLDENGHLDFDPNSASGASLFAHRMIRVLRGIYVPGIDDWVDTPVFWGPIASAEREGPVVSITAVGKEALLQDPHLAWRMETRSWKRGESVIDVMRSILTQMGETRFGFPAIDKKLPKPVTITRHEEPWPLLQRLAHSLNRQLFYDGSGRVRLRMWPENPVWTFHDGVDGSITTWPRLSYDISQVRNIVEVLGPKPDKGYTRIRAVAVAPPANYLSPVKLARNGVLSFLVDDSSTVEIKATAPGKSDPAEKKAKYHDVLVRKQAEAQEIADRRLRQLLRTQVSTTFDALPMPDLEESDVFAIRWDGGSAHARLEQGTIPLTCADAGGYGYVKRPQTRWRKTKHASRRAG